MMAVAGRPTTLDRRPQRQREAEAARCRSPAPPGDHALGGRCAVARRGGQGCWLFGGSGGHLRGVLVPPCDPQAQTTFSPPPRARSMVFYDGARAPWGLRRSLLFSRGVSASRVQIPHPHPCLSRDCVLGRFWAVCGCAFWCVRDAQKARRAGQKKTKFRRAWQPGCRQKPPGCQSQAGAATTSSSSLLPMLQ